MEKNIDSDFASYVTVFGKSPIAFVIVHVLCVDENIDDFVFDYINDSYEKLIGISKEKIIGHSYSEVFGKKSDQWNSFLGKVALDGVPFESFEYGDTIDCFVNLYVNQIKKGYCAVICSGLKESKRAEHGALNLIQQKYSLEKYRLFHDKSLIAYAIFNLTTDTTVDVFRCKLLASVQQSISMENFKKSIIESISCKSSKKAFCDLFNKENLFKKIRDGIEEQSIDFQRVLPSGKTIWVKSRFLLITEPKTSDIILIYSCYDINLRKSIEQIAMNIVDSEYDIAGCVNFIDSSSVLIYGKKYFSTKDNTSKNIEENYNYSLDRFIEESVLAEEKSLLKQNLQISNLKAKLKEKGNYELVVHVKDANSEILTKKIKFFSYDERTEIVFFTQWDITQDIKDELERQCELTEALKQSQFANKSKTEFFSRMSHDMRTPMNGILGMVELSEDENDINILKNNISKIKSSGKYLLGLINDTLDFNKIESGNLVLERSVVDAEELIDSVVTMIKTIADEKGVVFTFENFSSFKDCFVKLDVLRTKQIFINLLSNAVKFTSKDGSVVLRLNLLGRKDMISSMEFIVQDTGLGMSEDFIKNKIFKPFSQEYNSVSAKSAGTGLGLSIAKKLIDLMNGSIKVQSKLGEGTTFTINLDFERVDISTLKQEAKKDNVKKMNAISVLKGKRILMAEDNVLNAEIARRLLEKVGCVVDCAINGQECLNMFNLCKLGYYDIILMDVRMPVLDGIESCMRIRKLERSDAKTIPIIAMTANAYADDISKCMAAGMNRHLAKPIDMKLMYETIAEECEKKSN